MIIIIIIPPLPVGEAGYSIERLYVRPCVCM